MKKGKSRLKVLFSLVAFLAMTGITSCGSPEIKVKARPAAASKINPEYPAFTAGVLTLDVKGEKHKIPLTGTDESVYTNLPKGALGTTVSATLESDYWKLVDHNITLSNMTELGIVPNGRLGSFYGTVVDERGRPIREAYVQIGNDTILYSNHQGVFKADLSYSLQREKQWVTILKDGFEPVELTHTPGSNLLVHLNRESSGRRTVVRQGQSQKKEETFGEWAAKEGIRTGSDVIRSGVRRY